ncbi:unnamed protein product [Mytilus coruscus]|uniref:Uncharacterized protein n=1 Tax=Mytilus coruscus TaxID=42192 RepID=A0A6J8EV59_MYTCO|nr:unnamed protein product [Mytilus coruscus]
MLRASKKPSKAGKTPINYNKESQLQKLDNALQQLILLPEDEVVQFNIQTQPSDSNEDTTILFAQDQWTIPQLQYNFESETKPAALLVSVYNPFVLPVFSTPIGNLQPTKVTKPKMPASLLAHSELVSTKGPAPITTFKNQHAVDQKAGTVPTTAAVSVATAPTTPTIPTLLPISVTAVSTTSTVTTAPTTSSVISTDKVIVDISEGWNSCGLNFCKYLYLHIFCSTTFWSS